MAMKNIVFFGGSGAGKSSLINMLMGENVASVSASAVGCTLQSTSYVHGNFKYFDTAGFDEGSAGSISSSDAINNLFKLIASLKGGVNLLVYVIRKGRITSTIEKNYQLFVNALCQSKVPVLLVITHCENEEKPGVWWSTEEDTFVNQYKMTFKEVISACAVSGESANISPRLREIFNERYADTKVKLSKALETHSTSSGWSMGDTLTWFKAVLQSVLNVFSSVVNFLTNQPMEQIQAKLVELGIDPEQAKKYTEKALQMATTFALSLAAKKFKM